MENSSKNTWQVRLAALALFALGFLAGALVLNLYQARIQATSETSGRGHGVPFFKSENLTERLNLSTEQATEVDKIFGDAKAQLTELRKQSEPKFSEIRKQTEERLQQVLTPEQWQQFQQMKSEMRERRTDRKRGRRGNENSR